MVSISSPPSSSQNTKLIKHFTCGHFTVCVLSCFSWVLLFATPWTVAHQASLSMGFPRHEYWSGLPCLPPGDLPNPVIQLISLASSVLQVDSLPTEPSGKSEHITPERQNFQDSGHCPCSQGCMLPLTSSGPYPHCILRSALGKLPSSHDIFYLK